MRCAAGLDDVVGNPFHDLDRGGKSDALDTEFAGADRGGYADEGAVAVDESAAARSVGDRGVGLNHPVQDDVGVGLHLPAKARDDPDRQ